MAITVIRYSDRPELWVDTDAVSQAVWPEYNHDGEVLNRYWGRLFDEFPQFRFALYDDQDGVLAEGHAVPCVWDGTTDGLGDGIDAISVRSRRAIPARSPIALGVLAAEIRPQFQGRRLADRVLDAMADLARDVGLTHLIAPVRPSFEDHYPITPIERYVTWTRETGESFDPWIRVHIRRGAKIAKPIPPSMRITGTVAEWEQWTGMQFPDDGPFHVPGRSRRGRDRSRTGPRVLLGAERLDHPRRPAVMRLPAEAAGAWSLTLEVGEDGEDAAVVRGGGG